jgi:hypothetical protein
MTARVTELEKLNARVAGLEVEAVLDQCIASIEHADMSDGVCCCGDDMATHPEPMSCGHAPVDAGEYYAHQALQNARKLRASMDATRKVIASRNVDDLVAAAGRMCAHYETVFKGMSPDATKFSVGHRLTQELRTALAVFKT